MASSDININSIENVTYFNKYESRENVDWIKVEIFVTWILVLPSYAHSLALISNVIFLVLMMSLKVMSMSYWIRYIEWNLFQTIAHPICTICIFYTEFFFFFGGGVDFGYEKWNDSNCNHWNLRQVISKRSYSNLRLLKSKTATTTKIKNRKLSQAPKIV